MLKTVRLIIRQMLLAQESMIKMLDVSSIPPEQTKAVRCAIGTKRKEDVDDSVFYDVLLKFLVASLQIL